MPTARYLCNTLRYEIDGPISAMVHCHCSMCRKHHGTGFSTFAVAPIAGFRYTQGEERLVRYQSSAHGIRSFCAVCGSSGPWPMPERGIVAAPAAGLEEDPGIRQQRRLFVASKAPWDEIADDLPRHDAYLSAKQRLAAGDEARRALQYDVHHLEVVRAQRGAGLGHADDLPRHTRRRNRARGWSARASRRAKGSRIAAACAAGSASRRRARRYAR